MSDYNFKVKCVDVNVNLGTYDEGGVYEVKNGALSTNKGGNFKGTNQRLGFRNIDELNNWSSSKFEEVFDDKGEDKKVSKFKVGDKVRIIKNGTHCFEKGDIVELYEINGRKDMLRGKQRGNSRNFGNWIEFNEMELIKESTFTITTSDTTTTLTDGTHTTTINRYYTDKHDDMVALEEVVKKYKSEMDEINKDKEIKEAIDKFIKDNNYDVEVEVKRKVVK